MKVALKTLALIFTDGFVYGVFNSGFTRNVVFKRGETIAETYIDTIYVVLVLQYVEVTADTPVGGSGLISDGCDLVFMVGCAYSEFNYGKVAVFQVDASGSLILTIAAKPSLEGADSINTHRYTMEQRYGLSRQLQFVSAVHWHSEELRSTN